MCAYENELACCSSFVLFGKRQDTGSLERMAHRKIYLFSIVYIDTSVPKI